MLSMSQASQVQKLPFQKARMDEMLKQADEMAETISLMQRMYGLMQQLADTTHRMVGKTKELEDITNELRDHIADFDDFFRPIRNYFYWEPHCYNIPDLLVAADRYLTRSTVSTGSATRWMISSQISINSMCSCRR